MTRALPGSAEPSTSAEGRPFPVRSLTDVLEVIAAGAATRDVDADGLGAALDLLSETGALAFNARPGAERPPAADELALVREVARADSSLGRVLDGHLNGVERLAAQAPADMAEAEIAQVRAGRLRVGVWGGDPRPGEGEPAHIRRGTHPGFEVVDGVKTFCSGAGLIDRAMVLVRSAESPKPVSVWLDVSQAAHVEVDESWYRSSGLRASASHRVFFDGAPVLARLGEPGDISAQPWFGRDALRTAASWAGMVDSACAAVLGELAARPGRGTLEELSAGRLLSAVATITSWLDTAARAMDDGAENLWDVALHGRVAIAAAARTVLDEGARACGSHAFATGGALDRLRRDLDLFLLQHRLEPGLVRAGAAALDAARSRGSV